MTYVTNTRNFRVNMKPAGKARPRVTRLGTFNTEKTRTDEKHIQLVYSSLYGRLKPFEGAVHLVIFAYDSLPKSKPKSIEEEPYIVKPDADNIAKLVCDALNGIAYKDDAQIVQLQVVKKNRSRLITPSLDVYVSEYREAH